MPIRVPNNLPALEALHAEAVDIIPQQQAVSQDIRPLRLLLLNLMPKKTRHRNSICQIIW
jgi:homoserine O-succinyltransferase